MFLLIMVLVILSASGSASGKSLVIYETPNDGDSFVLDTISSAVKTIKVEVYELTDPDVIQALIDERQKGVTVEVLLNSHFPYGRRTNLPTMLQLQANNIDVHFGDQRQHTYFHEKAIIIDPELPSRKMLIMTMNLAPSYLGKPDRKGVSLDFAVLDKDQGEINVVSNLFNADWVDQPYVPTDDFDLVISNVDAVQKLQAQICLAKTSIHIFAQELVDKDIIDLLIAARKRGVEVKALIADQKRNLTEANLLQAVGCEVRVLVRPYEHSKVTITDASNAYIGSINYSHTSLTRNRELGIITKQVDIVTTLQSRFKAFWKVGVDIDNISKE